MMEMTKMIKMRKMVLLLLCGFVLFSVSGCRTSDAGIEEDRYVEEEGIMAYEDFPLMDGSTATLPLARAVASHFTGISEDEAELRVSFSTTDYAYYNLIDRTRDLLIVYEGSEEVQQAMANSGMDFEIKEIGYDALVFLTSEDNPVKSLTIEEIQGIYTGELSNWSQIGGEDKAIDAYQRNEDSGSQALMRKLVMGGLPMAEAPVELVPMTMGGLLEVVADYQNESGSLGYSVYYYVKNMYAVEGIKLLAVDGVQPSNETIADGSYPFINPFYAIIRADEPADSPARQIYDFLSESEGKALIEKAGYVSKQ